MSSEESGRRVRRGAKSCAECRRRKIRCIWSTDRSGLGHSEPVACDHCTARGRACIPQLVQDQASNATHMTARDRISHLEREMASLSALVKDRQEGISSKSDEASNVPEAVYDDVENEGDHASIGDDQPPSHLRLLFYNIAIDTNSQERKNLDQPFSNLSKGFMHAARAKLQPLLPSEEDVLRIAPFASDWLALYHSLFPSFFGLRSGNQLIINYERMHEPQVHPVAVAMYLLSVAITAQQINSESSRPSFNGGRSATSFVDAVCRTVEQTIVSNNALAGSVEGLETSMLFIRLLMGRGDLKRTWLTLRRMIALAELIGLPQASYKAELAVTPGVGRTEGNSNQETLQKKAAVWESICATDRNLGMMLSLPAGTARYAFPLNESIWRDGQISAQAYNYQLSKISTTVIEIDELCVRGVSDAESYEKVLSADRSLRELAASVSRAWWQQYEGGPIAELLVKFWHCYITLRVHLRPAIKNDSGDKYIYSRIACWNACQDAMCRFPKFRPLIPSGFFVCRVLDVQAVTVATFLLLSSRSPELGQQPASLSTGLDSHTIELVQQVVECFKTVCDKTGSDFAQEAIAALTSLMARVQGQDPRQPDSLTLQIPLLGKVHIDGKQLTHQSSSTNPGGGRGPPVAIQSYSWNSGPEDGSQYFTNIPAAPPVAEDPLSWSFEFDNASLWTQISLPIDDMIPIDDWMSTDTINTVI